MTLQSGWKYGYESFATVLSLLPATIPEELQSGTFQTATLDDVNVDQRLAIGRYSSSYMT